MNIKRNFSKAICLSNPEKHNSATLALSHYTFDAIMQANSEDDIFERVSKSFPKYKYVVVWTNDTYELFKSGMNRYGIVMPRHRVIVLQQLLMHIAGDGINQIGFERALKKTGIEYQRNYLHYSKHDVSYMYQLFCKCYYVFRKLTKKEFCFINTKSHILHIQGCRYMHSSNEACLSKTTKDMIFKGNRLCKVCGYEDDWNRLLWIIGSGENQRNNEAFLRRLSLTEENMSMICDKFHLDYNIARDAVFIRTPFSRWIVYINNNRVIELMHENYRKKRNVDRKKCLEGYHKQKLHSNRFYDVIAYIKDHDTSMLNGLGNKSRVEVILDKIKAQKE